MSGSSWCLASIGYVFNKLSYPLAPLVLALVLGDMAESSFRQAMLLSQGSLSIFWSNALVGSIVSLGAHPPVLAVHHAGLLGSWWTVKPATQFSGSRGGEP